jgi:hypothetical protein
VLGNAGVFFDPLDPGSIAAAVTGLLSSQEQLLRMRSAGRCRASQFDARTSALRVASERRGRKLRPCVAFKAR